MSTDNPFLSHVAALSPVLLLEIQKPPPVPSDTPTMSQDLDRYSIVVLVVFALSICLVVRPLSIPLPRSLRLPWRNANSPPLRIHIGTLTSPLAAVLLLWASTCISSRVVRDGIVGVDGIKPYSILILFLSLAYMAISLDITGVFQAAAFWVSNKGGSSGWRLYLYFYLMLTGFGILVGNDPVVLSGTVFLVYWTEAAGVDQTAWLFAEFAAANTASMVLFVGNITNVVICEGLGITNIAYTAYTIFPFLACSILCYAALAFQFRNTGSIPKVMPEVARLDPRSALVDPVGAVVGTIIFAACLVVLLGVSFVDTEVWEITLPFAGAKFVFDLVWDYWRFTRRRALQEATPAAGAVQEKGDNRVPRKIDDCDPSDDECSCRKVPISPQVFPANDPTSATLELPQVEEQTKTDRWKWVRERWPTIIAAVPRLPFALVPFTFCQFMLIEALAYRGWIRVFARWLQIASGGHPYPVLLLVGVLGVLLCNVSGTNIGATVLLTKVLRAARLSRNASVAGAIALAISSNIGAVSFVFSASLAGLLWRTILKQKGIVIRQMDFAKWNMLPLFAMTVAGLGVACAELAVIMRADLAGSGQGF